MRTWGIVVENTNHPRQSTLLIKSSHYPLLKELRNNLDTMFKDFEYKSFRVCIKILTAPELEDLPEDDYVGGE